MISYYRQRVLTKRGASSLTQGLALRAFEAQIQRAIANGTLDPSVGRALREGLQYAVSLGGAGLAVGGPWGAAASAIAGLAIGIADGVLGTDRAAFSDQLHQLINLLAPVQRYLMWATMRGFANYIRRTESKPPTRSWMLTDTTDINVAGSRQILTAWTLQQLWNHDCMFDADTFNAYPWPYPDGSHHFGTRLDPATPFQALTALQRYAVGCGITDQMLDTDTIDGHCVAAGAFGCHNSWELYDSFIPGAIGETYDANGTRIMAQRWLSDWARAHKDMSAGQVRNALVNGPGVKLTDVTDQPWTRAHKAAMDRLGSDLGVS